MYVCICIYAYVYTYTLIYVHVYVHIYVYERRPQNLEFIYKKVCIPTCLNCSHFQSSLHLMQYTYQDIQSSFELVNFDAFLVLLLCFVSVLPHGQNVPFEGFLHPGKQKKSLGMRSGE